MQRSKFLEVKGHLLADLLTISYFFLLFFLQPGPKPGRPSVASETGLIDSSSETRFILCVKTHTSLLTLRGGGKNKELCCFLKFYLDVFVFLFLLWCHTCNSECLRCCCCCWRWWRWFKLKDEYISVYSFYCSFDFRCIEHMQLSVFVRSQWGERRRSRSVGR